MASASAFLDDSPVRQSADAFLGEPPAPQPDWIQNELTAAGEQQQMEREAGRTKTFTDVKETLRDMADFPGKAAVAAGSGITGAPIWLSNEEVEKPFVSPEALKLGLFGAAYPLLKYPQSDNPVAKSVRGVAGGIADTASGLTSPANLAMLPLGAGETASKMLATVFAGQAAIHFPDQWKAFNEASDPEEKARIATEVITGLGLPALALLHSASRVAPKEDVTQAPTDRGGSQPQSAIRAPAMPDPALDPRDNQGSRNPQTPDALEVRPSQADPAQSQSLYSSSKPTLPEPPIASEEPLPAANKKQIDLSGMGAGVTDNLYDALWSKLQNGDLTEGGMPSALLRKADAEIRAGNIKTQQELRDWVQAGGKPSEGLPAGPSVTQRFQESSGPVIPPENGSSSGETSRPPKIFTDMSDEDLTALWHRYRSDYSARATEALDKRIELIGNELAHRAGLPEGTAFGNRGFRPTKQEPIGVADAIAEIQRRNAPEPANAPKVEVAIRLRDGRVITAPSHSFAYDKANAEGLNLAGSEEGFTVNGKFLYRDEALKAVGGSTVEDIKSAAKSSAANQITEQDRELLRALEPSETVPQVEREAPVTEPEPQAPAGTSNRLNAELYGDEAVPSGKGADTGALLDDARTGIATGKVDPYEVLSRTRKNGIATAPEYAALAAEHERLVNDAVQRQKAGDPTAPEAAQRAEDFANAIQPHKTAASDLMRLFQGDVNFDLSTQFGMEQYMKAEIDRAPKPAERAWMQKRANGISAAERESGAAISRADAKVQRHYAKVREIPMEEAAARVKKFLADCQI